MHRDITALRNVGIVSTCGANSGVAKTSCVQRMLRLATNVDPSTVRQGEPIGASWVPRSGPFAGDRYDLTLFDVPSVTDAPFELERTLAVSDGAVLVVDARDSVKNAAKPALECAFRHDVPVIAFVSGIDDVGADFEARVNELEAELGSTAIVLARPYSDARGVHIASVLEERLLVETGDGDVLRTKLPDAVRALVREDRQRIVDACAESDDGVLGASSVGMELGADELVRALRKKSAAKGAKVLFVACGSAISGKGICALLDAVVSLVPSPADTPPVFGIDPRRGLPVARFARDEDALAAVVIKSVGEPATAPGAWVRVVSGTLTTGEDARAFPIGKKGTIGAIFAPTAEGLQEVDEVGPGRIVLAFGVGSARPGDTLADPQAPIVVSPMRVPEALVSVSLDLPDESARDVVVRSLATLVDSDPSLRVESDDSLDRVVVSGMSAAHLASALSRLPAESVATASSVSPISRVTIASDITVTREAPEGRDAAARLTVRLTLRPAEPGTGVVVVNDAPRTLDPGLAQTIARAIEAESRRGAGLSAPGTDESGPRLGQPPFGIDVVAHVEALEGEASYALSVLQETAAKAFRDALALSRTEVREPMAFVAVTLNPVHEREVVADLEGRRAVVVTRPVHDGVRVEARVPLANMVDYAATLEALTGGYGRITARVDGYEPARRAHRQPPSKSARAGLLSVSVG